MDKTAALKNAIDYAKKNPDSDDAKQLRKRLESGMYKTELARIKAGKFEDEKEKTKVGKFIEGAKAAIGGFAAGVGGVALTAEDWAARKGLFGKRVKAAMEGKPTLQEEFRSEMGGDIYKNVYNVGRFGGEVASLAAPVGAIGKASEKATQFGLGSIGIANKAKNLTKLVRPNTIKNVSKVARAGVEGAAFTAGIGLQEGEKQSLSDYALNTGLNMVFPVAGIGLKAVGETVPSRIINSLIKPLQKDFAYGKNPGRTVSELGIVANDFDTLISKIDEKREEIGQLIGNTTSKSRNLPNVVLDDVIAPIDEAIAKANKSPRTNSELIKRLEDTKADLMDNIAAGTDPQALKKIVGDLTKWTGNASDDKAINMSLKQTYGKISSKMDDALKNELSEAEFAVYKKAQEQYGDLISAKNAATYRDKLLERQDLISFGAKNMGVISALTTAIATGGTAIPTILAGLGGVAIDKAMATPMFKTRLAKLLSKLAPKDIETFFEKVPTAKTLFPGRKMDNILRESRLNLEKLKNKIEETPNKEGGFVVNPLNKETIPENSLIAEAKKYKSAEDFVKAQGTPVYHGSPYAKKIEVEGFKLGKNENLVNAFGRGTYLGTNKSSVSAYAGLPEKGGGVVNSYLPKNIKLKKVFDKDAYKLDTKKLIEQGYDGVILDTFKGNHITIFDPSIIKTKSQLIDIWKKANNNPKEFIQKASEYTPIFREKVDKIAKNIGLEFEHGPVKTEERLLEKANADYGGDINRVSDINRSVMFMNELSNQSTEFFNLIKETEKHFNITRKKFDIGIPSYNKILLNVDTPAGISEIQLTTKKLWDAKINKGGDVLYGLARSERTPKKIAEHLNKRMEELYQFTDEGAFEKASKGSNEGGFTYDLIRGIDFGGTPHISVSPFPERTMKIQGETTTKHLAEFLKKNFNLLKKKGFAAGGWYNKADGMTYLDVVVTVPKEKAHLATKLGNKSNQIAGFDLETFNEIPYKGDGTISKVAPITERMEIIKEILNRNKAKK